MKLAVFLFLLVDFFWFTMCQLHKYHYIDQQLDWTQAQQFCRKSYTDLATVRSMADIDQLKNAFKNRNGAWIGLHNSNTWRWSLPDLQFKEEDTKWGGGEPKDGKNCGAIWKTHAKWEAISCEKSTDFICYNDRDSSKRLYFIQQKKNWFEAQEYCEKEHTGLVGGAQLKELEEACFCSHLRTDSSLELCRAQKLSQLFMPDNGVADVTVDSLDQVCTSHDIFIGLIRDTWAWSDGSSFSSRSWHPVFPKTAGNKNCIMMNNKGEWINHDCKNERPFICYTDHVILINENRTWEEALYYCRHHHHDLVTITNLDEQRWVQEKTKNATTPYVWTGLRYTCTLGFWFWVSDEVVRYKNWASPEQVNECDMSGAMETGGEHKWFKINDEEKFNFFCSK